MTCPPRSHITDSRFFGQGYATEECRRIFCDLRRLQRWLDVEKALAQCQAELGIIPREAAARLAATARLDLLDLEAVRRGIAETGHSLVPLLREWQRIAGEAGQFIHFGATTQDIQDTAQSLELAEVCGIVARDLDAIIALLADLSRRYRDLVMVGRTHGRQALPTTLGLKMAGWLDETLRNRERFAACRGRLLVCQLFGGVGTMDSLSERARELLVAFADRLGLAVPEACWHAARDRTAELTTVLALISGGLARIANEICQLAKDEIGELSEPFTTTKIGSSTMPHKRNPELCEQVVVLARLVKGAAGSGLDTLVNEHERDYRAVRLEWAALADAATHTCAALAIMRLVLGGLVVHEERIRANLERAAVKVSTEALMFLLGEKAGKQTAHQIIHQAAMRCTGACELVDELLAVPEVAAHFDRRTIEAAIDPEHHTGQAGAIVDALVARAHSPRPDKEETTPPCPLERNGRCAVTGVEEGS